MADLETFMPAAGFADVTADGDDLHIENLVGLATVALDVVLVGEILDATVIKRQRCHELESQFD